MDPICLTLEVFQPVSGWLKLVAASKTELIISTFEVSQLLMSWLKFLAPANM
jgi:hypothetical protein